MELQTRNFGKITIEEDKKIVFKEGIPGFENLKTFVLLEEEGSAFCYLQAIEDGEIAFAVIDPYLLKEDYAPHIEEGYFEKLGGEDSKEFSLYVIATVGERLEDTTVNLQGPLLIHVGRRLGVQVIVEDKHYGTKHKVLELMKERS